MTSWTRWHVSIQSIEQRIERGRKALALAKERGLDVTSWEEELARLQQAIDQAHEVACRTHELLAARGWCLWQCRALDDEVIAVARDGLAAGLPGGYPVFTEQELRQLIETNSSTLKLVHQAKKLAGVKVVAVEKRAADRGAG